MPSSFAGTTAVVTGASSGIGRATAVALATAGVQRLIVHYHRNQQGAQQTADQIRALGCEASIVAADLADDADRRRLLATAIERLQRIQTWVNNAGVDVLTGEAADWEFGDKLRRLLEVDVVGTIELSRLVGNHLAQQTTFLPSMTFIGWDQAPCGMEGDAGQMFGPVKAAVMAFAASLAQTLAPAVRVNTIAPGWIQTAWGESTSEYWDNRAQGQSLMQRWGHPDDIAKAIVYASDPANTFLTGQTINLNGGWNRRYQSGDQAR